MFLTSVSCSANGGRSLNNATKWIVGAIAVIALGVVVVLVMNPFKPKAAFKAVVQISPDGFLPASLRVKVGTQVEWTNLDTKNHQVLAGPASSSKGLGSGTIAPKSSFSYTFQTAGTYHYQDQPNTTGVIIVE